MKSFKALSDDMRTMGTMSLQLQTSSKSSAVEKGASHRRQMWKGGVCINAMSGVLAATDEVLGRVSHGITAESKVSPAMQGVVCLRVGQKPSW